MQALYSHIYCMYVRVVSCPCRSTKRGVEDHRVDHDPQAYKIEIDRRSIGIFFACSNHFLEELGGMYTISS